MPLSLPRQANKGKDTVNKHNQVEEVVWVALTWEGVWEETWVEVWAWVEPWQEWEEIWAE